MLLPYFPVELDWVARLAEDQGMRSPVPWFLGFCGVVALAAIAKDRGWFVATCSRVVGNQLVPEPCWLFYIDRFQAGLGALLGLLAILAGALFNAHLNRLRDNRLRRRSTLSLAAALSAEVRSFKTLLEHRQIESHYKSAIDRNEFNNLPILLVKSEYFAVYRSNTDRLGLLPFGLAGQLTYWHSLCISFGTGMSFLANDPEYYIRTMHKENVIGFHSDIEQIIEISEELIDKIDKLIR